MFQMSLSSTLVLLTTIFVCQSTVTAEEYNCSHQESFPNGIVRTGSWTPRILYYVCNEGFTLSGTEQQVCQRNGTWDPPEMPTCIESQVKCSQPDIMSGHVAMKHMLTNSSQQGLQTFVVQCDDGYIIDVIGKAVKRLEMLCRNGYWVVEDENGNYIYISVEYIMCSAVGCKSAPIIENARKVLERDQEGDHVTYKCNSGYVFENAANSKLVCKGGKWTGHWPICVLSSGSCPDPKEIANGWFTGYKDDGSRLGSSPYKTKYMYGYQVRYSCNTGYRLIGDSSMVCDYLGWEGSPPLCIQDQQVTCPALSNIMNGICVCETKINLAECSPFYFGQHVECVCDRGYALRGESILTCRKTGAWDYDLPTCVQGGVIDTQTRPSQEPSNSNHMSTLAIVVATACSVLGVLLLIMVIMIFRRRKPRPPSRLCRPSATPPPYSRVHNNSLDELDRYLMIGYENPNENTRVSLPSYDEAMSSSQSRIGNRLDHMARSDEGQGQVGEYRPLPSIPGSFRANQMMTGENTSRHSIITTSTMNRDGVSELFGSIDTVNVSVSDASTAVTIETLDSATSHHSNMSRRATAGSIASENSNENLATEDAPLLESTQRDDSDKSDDDGNRSGRDE